MLFFLCMYMYMNTNMYIKMWVMSCMHLHMNMYMYMKVWLWSDVICSLYVCVCPRMEKSLSRLHELLFSRTVNLNYPASAELNCSKSSKRGVRGVSCAISLFLGLHEYVYMYIKVWVMLFVVCMHMYTNLYMYMKVWVWSDVICSMYVYVHEYVCVYQGVSDVICFMYAHVYEFVYVYEGVSVEWCYLFYVCICQRPSRRSPHQILVRGSLEGPPYLFSNLYMYMNTNMHICILYIEQITSLHIHVYWGVSVIICSMYSYVYVYI